MRVTGLELFAVPPGWLFHVDGHIAVPTAPGLGVEIDEERVREAAAHGRMWHDPVWRNDDGTVAEW